VLSEEVVRCFAVVHLYLLVLSRYVLLQLLIDVPLFQRPCTQSIYIHQPRQIFPLRYQLHAPRHASGILQDVPNDKPHHNRHRQADKKHQLHTK